MANGTLTDLSVFINQQIEARDSLREILSKAAALLFVSLEHDLLQHPKMMMQYYIWSIYDLVEQARLLNEQALSELKLEKTQSVVND